MKTLFLCSILFASAVCHAATLDETINARPLEISGRLTDASPNFNLRDAGETCEKTFNGVTFILGAAGQVVKIKNSEYEISLAQTKKHNAGIQTPLLLLNNVAIPLKLSIATPDQKRKAQSKMRQLLVTFSKSCKNAGLQANSDNFLEKFTETDVASDSAVANMAGSNSGATLSGFITESQSRKSVVGASGANDDGEYDDQIDPEWFTSSFWSDYANSNYNYIMNDFWNQQPNFISCPAIRLQCLNSCQGARWLGRAACVLIGGGISFRSPFGGVVVGGICLLANEEAADSCSAGCEAPPQIPCTPN